MRPAWPVGDDDLETQPAAIGMKPSEKGSLSSRIYHRLRDSLISGSFAPGHRLRLQELADSLGTSITPAREACLRLASEQALHMRSGRFFFVPELTYERYWQIRVMRIALESLAADFACQNARKEDTETLQRIHDRFVECEKAGDQHSAHNYNRDFHFTIYRLSGMPMLVSQIESLWALMGPILMVYYSEMRQEYLGAGEHLQLIKALSERDGRLARVALENDIVRGGMNLMSYFKDRG